MASVNKTANIENESSINDNDIEKTSETSDDQRQLMIKNESEMEESEEDELSVGSPESNEEKHSTTAALRILRKRKNSENSEDEEKPLDFTKKEGQGGEPNSYFLPFKKLEMTTEQNDQKSKKRGVAGFSIDDILSHKTAALKEQEKLNNQASPPGQPIVRPWDIVAASAAAAHSAATNGAVPGSSLINNRSSKSSSKNQQGQDSPLDALFQMASKTFEGLKAKSGKQFLKAFFSVQMRHCMLENMHALFSSMLLIEKKIITSFSGYKTAKIITFQHTNSVIDGD